MARGRPGNATFSRRSPRIRIGSGRVGIPFRPMPEVSAADYGREPLFGVFQDGRRVYLPPSGRPGIPLDEAKRIAGGLDGATVVQVWTPDPGEAA